MILQLKSLTELDLGRNKLTQIDNVGGLSKLTKLSVDSNLLQTIPTSVSKLTNLERVSFSYNKIRAIQNEINTHTLTSLTSLSISGNELSQPIPANWLTLSSLAAAENYFQLPTTGFSELIGMTELALR